MASAGKPRGIVINLSFLRAARWFGPDRAVNYAKVVAIAYVPILLWIYKGAIGSVGCDFMAFWSASNMLHALARTAVRLGVGHGRPRLSHTAT